MAVDAMPPENKNGVLQKMVESHILTAVGRITVPLGVPFAIYLTMTLNNIEKQFIRLESITTTEITQLRREVDKLQVDTDELNYFLRNFKTDAGAK